MHPLFNDLNEAFIWAPDGASLTLRNNLHRGLFGQVFSLSSDHDWLSLNREESLSSLHGILMSMASKGCYLETLPVIHKMMDLVAESLGVSRDVTDLNKNQVGTAIMKSMSLFRFHLLLLKTEAYLQNQIGNVDVAKALLEKVLEFDGCNRLGARELLESLPATVISDELSTNG